MEEEQTALGEEKAAGGGSPSPGSRTRLRSASGLSSAALGLDASGLSSRSRRVSSWVWFSSSSLELPPLVKGPGRGDDDGVLEANGLSLRSRPGLVRLEDAGRTRSYILYQRLSKILLASVLYLSSSFSLLYYFYLFLRSTFILKWIYLHHVIV